MCGALLTLSRQSLPTRPETASIRAEQAKLAFPDVPSSFQRPLKGPAFGCLDPPFTEPDSPIPLDFPLTRQWQRQSRYRKAMRNQPLHSSILILIPIPLKTPRSNSVPLQLCPPHRPRPHSSALRCTRCYRDPSAWQGPRPAPQLLCHAGGNEGQPGSLHLQLCAAGPRKLPRECSADNGQHVGCGPRASDPDGGVGTGMAVQPGALFGWIRVQWKGEGERTILGKYPLSDAIWDSGDLREDGLGSTLIEMQSSSPSHCFLTTCLNRNLVREVHSLIRS
jgi:hypothetical protein